MPGLGTTECWCGQPKREDDFVCLECLSFRPRRREPRAASMPFISHEPLGEDWFPLPGKD
jgi:hypothetical protein